LITVAFIELVTTVPPLQAVLKTGFLDVQQWLMVIAFAVIGTFWLEVRKGFTYGKGAGR